MIKTDWKRFIEKIGILAITLMLVPSVSTASSPGGKSDIIVLKNGDRVTGEVIKQEASLLELTRTQWAGFISNGGSFQRSSAIRATRWKP